MDAKPPNELRYADLPFFRDLFRRHTGMTPSAYREQFGKLTFERGELLDGRGPNTHLD
ncbi:MAG TPA: hypothetical protein VM532_03305 [Burkholderiales bacterium]|nr:hypothetical protein [Burkholderiales bacterium]